MLITIWGCRGSLATPGPDTLRFGGNTSCVAAELSDGTLIVLDAGTGIRNLGLQLAGSGPREIHLCLTHFHLDHVEGIGFFAPLFDPGTELHIWGPPSTERSLEQRVSLYLSPPVFPLTLSDIPARLRFHDVPEEPWRIGDADVFATEVSHPGTTIGYRLAENSSVLAYLPDHEPAVGVPLEHSRPTGSPASQSPLTQPCSSTMPNTAKPSTRARSVGATRASLTPLRSQTEPPSDSCSSSTMTPSTTTGSWTSWNSGPASYGQVTVIRPPSPAKG